MLTPSIADSALCPSRFHATSFHLRLRPRMMPARKHFIHTNRMLSCTTSWWNLFSEYFSSELPRTQILINNNNNHSRFFSCRRHILVSPKERKVVIVEDVFCPTEIRDTLAKVLFKHFEVLSIMFVPTHLVILSTLAIETALVVDIGYKEATVLPVCSGVQVLKAWQAQPLAAEAVHAEIKRQLLENEVPIELLSADVIENIKVRTCFVTTLERSRKYRDADPPTAPPSVDYPVEGKRIIQVPGALRETAFQVMFPEDNDRMGLPYIILDAVLACPMDVRRQLLENIVLIGGSAMVQGLKSRLRDEILDLVKSDWYKDKLFIDCVKFHSLPAKENFAAWLGGSIYGGTDFLNTKSLTRDVYAKLGRVPDWSNLDDNRPFGN